MKKDNISEKQNNFNTLVSQIDTVHKTIQAKSIQSVSTGLTIRKWLIGYYIVEYEQNGEDRAEYGAKIIENLVIELLKIDDPLKRLFYEVEGIKGHWSVRELKRQIKQDIFSLIEDNADLSKEPFSKLKRDMACELGLV